jgi:hypothetical protein
MVLEAGILSMTMEEPVNVILTRLPISTHPAVGCAIHNDMIDHS